MKQFKTIIFFLSVLVLSAACQKDKYELDIPERPGDCNSKKWQNRACTSELGSKRCCPYRRRIRCS